MSILVIDHELIELVDGEFVKSDIELPDNLKVLSYSMDCKIIALCEVTDYILIIYELVGRQFVLKHKVDYRQMEIPSDLINVHHFQYIQNLLIIMHTIKSGVYLQTVIDLETLNILHVCYSCYFQYCDGILSFPPLFTKSHKQIYHNINLADKTITTGTAPYFMEGYEKLITDIYKSNSPSVCVSRCITFVGNDHYRKITGTLLGTGVVDQTGDKFYIDYFIKTNKMEIAPGAPVVEYEYKGKYLYIIANTTGALTKASSTHSDN